ncbi:protein Largen [Callorhinchus milii]|uniref:Proline rich 16 n=1 Tax=Callorhinchus milii TaxID=7868 RepID=A0A4W3IMI3_CALMI|nr:protein Largen [Callorhinchus milii]|eukprot:gi/632962779/ref/XP_007897515.1/ PREDICTED: proline-rich protein 16 [Callorhinchus milii]
MSGKPKESAACKAKVKQQIKTIVEDLELVLGDLKDVAKELKEVVDQIDNLTCDLQLEEEMTDSSKTDTLNSTSSSTTASSLDKVKVSSDGCITKTTLTSSAILTVLKRTNPPPPPPRLTPVRCEEPKRPPYCVNSMKTNGALLRNGALLCKTEKMPNGDVCNLPGSNPERLPKQPVVSRVDKDKCGQVTRERVRFNEEVQYHGYCPDCDVQYDMRNRDVHLHGEVSFTKRKPPHQCPPLENGGSGSNFTNSFPTLKATNTPPPTAPKPQKTILRKSTTTTV